jgi:hypothetical protein
MGTKASDDMRAELKAEIGSIEPLDEVEREHIADVLAWIDSDAELCRLEKPATPPKHLVSYFVLVDDDHVLLVDHKMRSSGCRQVDMSSLANFRAALWRASFEKSLESN